MTIGFKTTLEELLTEYPKPQSKSELKELREFLIKNSVSYEHYQAFVQATYMFCNKNKEEYPLYNIYNECIHLEHVDTIKYSNHWRVQIRQTVDYRSIKKMILQEDDPYKHLDDGLYIAGELAQECWRNPLITFNIPRKLK